MWGALRRCCAVWSDSALWRVAAFAVACFLAAELGYALMLRSDSGDLATYWPPSGIYLAGMLVASRWQTRLQLIAAACLAGVLSDVWMHGAPPWGSLGFCVANTVEALAGAWGAHRLNILQKAAIGVRDVTGLALVGVAYSGPAAALIGATVLTLESGRSWVDAFRDWWILVTVGQIVFTPLFLSVLRLSRPRISRATCIRMAEGTTALLILAAVSYAVFHIGERPVAYLTVPLSLWVALRAGTPGVALGNVLLSVIAVWYTVQGDGPLGQIQPLAFREIFLQVFAVTASLSSLMLTAVVNERQRSLDERIASDERFRDLFNNVSDLVVVTDLHGSVQFANQAWIDLVDDADGQSHLVDRLDSDAADVLRHVLDVLPEAGVLNGVELRVKTRNGACLDLEGSFSCRGVDGGANRVRIIFRDVTTRKVTAERLEQAHQQLEAANMQLRLLASTDGLTALANRRAFHERLEQECHAAVRHDRPLSVILLDVDHFKSYNDSFGHPAGDDALRTVGWLLKEAIREIDVAGRVGGEEFAIILPETGEDEALEVAERLRRAIGEHRWPLRRITASLGTATLYGSDNDRELIVAAADQALYQAKRGGRDQTVKAGYRRLPSLARSN